MKRSQVYFILTAILTFVFFAACGIKSSTNSGSNITNAGNSSSSNQAQQDPALAKSTHAFPEMPANIMKTELKAVDGTTFTIKDYEGKVVLVNLWATWCGPCRMEMPELVKMEDEYKEKGFMIVGLDVDPEPTEMVKSFVEKQGLNYKIGWSTPPVHSALLGISQLGAIPQSFLITKDGRLAKVFKGYDPTRTPQDVRNAIEDALARTSE